MSNLDELQFQVKLHFSRLCRVAAVIMACMFAVYVTYEFHSIYQNPLLRLPRKLQKYVSHLRRIDTPDVNVHNLRLKLELLNKQPLILNSDKFRGVEDDTPIIVVQVHEDVERLQYLVLSMALVRDIDNALIVFSHNHYNETINELIKSIDFCKVMQIFYPHSLQLNPFKFPGMNINDCYSNSTDVCRGRDARLVENKQHWWWKANFIFERTPWASQRDGLVIFLEEDNYVAPDLLHIYRYVQKSFLYFPHVDIVSFGRPYRRSSRSDLMLLEPWQPPFHVGLAFNSTLWRRLKLQDGDYCMYDDYNWNYSLLNMFNKFLKGHADMIGCQIPRVFSSKEFGSCESIFKKVNERVDNMQWFPEKVKAVFLFGPRGRLEPQFKAPHRVGGWSDIRDQILCLDTLTLTTTQEQRYYEAHYDPKSIENNSMF